MNSIPITVQVPEDFSGQRLDVVLARLLDQYSRRRLQDWIRGGFVRVDGEVMRPRDPVHGGENIEVWVQEGVVASHEAQDIPLDIVYADEDVIIINKAAGQVMHPAPGHPDSTLMNAVLWHFPETASLSRAGIVHRLDQDTTGLVAVGRNEQACTALTRQLQARTMHRHYQALVRGELISGQTIEAPIGRHPRARQQMCVRDGGREAVTHIRIHQRYVGLTLLHVRLQTGRTHQIRVHLAHLGHPVIGDPVYGGRTRIPSGVTKDVRARVEGFGRQALHACVLRLKHPGREELCEWEAPLPDDFQQLLGVLDPVA